MIWLNQSCYRSVTSQPLVTLKASKKGRSLLRCKERHELRAWDVSIGYQAFALVVGDFDMLSQCQLPLCVQWQESIGWHSDCGTSFLLDVSQVV